MRVEKLLIVLFTSALMLGGCKHTSDPEDPVVPSNPSGTFKLVINPHWNGQAFDHLSEYQHVLGYRLRFDQFNAYLGDIALTSGAQNTVVSRIELFRLIENLIDNRKEREYQIAPGSYDGIQIGIGVPADLNAIDPGDQASAYVQALGSGAGTHWGWLDYRFVMLDGYADLTGTAGAPMNELFSYHNGLDPYYREVNQPINIEIVEDSTTVLTVNFDVSRMFYSASDTIDMAIPAEQFLHGGQGSGPLNQAFSDNILSSVTLTQ